MYKLSQFELGRRTSRRWLVVAEGEDRNAIAGFNRSERFAKSQFEFGLERKKEGSQLRQQGKNQNKSESEIQR